MELTFRIDRNEGPKSSGPCTVGWFYSEPKGSLVYFPPERVKSRDTNKSHAKSASRCPAVVQLESRYFMVRCPFDLHLGFRRDKNGKAVIQNLDGSMSSVRVQSLARALTLVNEAEWRFPDRPVLQLSLPYCFIAEEPCYITQLDAFLHYRPTPLPGTIFGGRFPIHAWARPLVWAFEWHDTSKELMIKRGDPLFYCQFETNAPERAVQLVEAERTPELLEWVESMAGVVNMVNQTFSLFAAAEAARPAKLIVPKEG